MLASFIVSEPPSKTTLAVPRSSAAGCHLRACTALPGVTIQVMPFGNSVHAGHSGPFVLLETADHQHLAYSETQLGSQLISDPDNVSVLTAKYGMLRMQALDEQETQGLLDLLLGET